MRAANYAVGEAHIFRDSILIELDKHRVRQPIDSRIETAYPITQTLWQHGNHAVRQINAVSAPAGFAIERALRFYISGNIGNMHAKTPPTVVNLLDVDCVVEIARVIGINGDDKFFAQVLASL